MVDSIDSSQNFAVGLAGVEGQIIIQKITAKGIEVYPTANPVSAIEGEEIPVIVTTINNGDTDMCFCSLINENTQEVIHTFRAQIGGGYITDWNFIGPLMPAEDLILRVDAGHEE